MILHVNHTAPHGRLAAPASELVGALLALVEDGSVDTGLLPALRVHLDWIQYRANFREPVSVRRATDAAGAPVALAEIAVDLRQAEPGRFREELARALATLGPDAADDDDRVWVDDWAPMRESIIWRFNRLFWQRLGEWERATGRGFEDALPSGKSDANHPQAVADAVADFWTLLRDMDKHGHLPAEIFALEIGVGSGLRAALWLETRKQEGGLRARLERAASTVAVLRGLGYAGAYIGGTHDAGHVAWIIRRSEELAPRWEALAEELHFGDPTGFHLYGRRHTRSPAHAPAVCERLAPRLLGLMGRLLPVTHDTWLRRLLKRLSAWADKRPAVAAAVERVELAVKKPMFGCQACGNCVLGHMEYVCPQTCPKQMRNGPCGGTLFGRCEVVDQPCIWVSVWDRAKAADRVDALKVYVPPPNRSLSGTSSWINYFLDRDSRP